jgi:hypothetical protein
MTRVDGPAVDASQALKIIAVSRTERCPMCGLRACGKRFYQKNLTTLHPDSAVHMVAGRRLYIRHLSEFPYCVK